MKSFIGWIGGKNLLRKEIVNRFPKERIDFYVEVFGGAAWVLFEKDRCAKTEVYNDLNGEIVNLFRCVKFHCDELQRELQYVLNSRELFENYKAMNIVGMTDIQRAARFFILLKTSYGAKAKGGTFGCVKKDVSLMVIYLKAIENRLKNVVIENKDFELILTTFSKKNTLFYLDPPYYGTEKYYTAEFSLADHERLFKCISQLECKFILSYNDCVYIRNMYKAYSIFEVERSNNLSKKQDGGKFKELIIMNY